jgi:hypothetical protein
MSRTLTSSFAVLFALALTLSPAGVTAAPPSNDDFANATEVTQPLPFEDDTVNTNEATVQVGEPSPHSFECGEELDKTVWYKFTPDDDMAVSANTFGSRFDTVVAVWEGSDIDSLTLVGCNNDARFDGLSSVVFRAELGEEYRIQVAGNFGDSGPLTFRVRTTAAGFIDGTVTDEALDPLASICVAAMDAVFGSGFFEFGQIALTAADGTYRIAVRPGEYLVFFIDCEQHSFIPEWWDDATEVDDADEVVTTAGVVESDIDAALAPGCPGWASHPGNQIVGTPDSETLTGTSEDDIICGLGGNDLLRGKDGRDVLLGGPGSDDLRGGARGDWMHGGSGNDILRGGDGPDALFGGRGQDDLRGGAGRDFLNGGRDRDRCDGGTGRDFSRRCEVKLRIP